MGWKPNHKPMREKYNPVQNAAEKRHERHVQKQPCFGCGRLGSSAHHTMLEFDGKRWKRDHRWRLPLCWNCHQGPQGVHGLGSERKWLASVERTEGEAIALMARLWGESDAA